MLIVLPCKEGILFCSNTTRTVCLFARNEWLFGCKLASDENVPMMALVRNEPRAEAEAAAEGADAVEEDGDEDEDEDEEGGGGAGAGMRNCMY